MKEMRRWMEGRLVEMLNCDRNVCSLMKQRRATLPPKLKKVSDEITDAIKEAKKIAELSIQEEVLVELEKVNSVLEQAKKEITRIMRLD